jgi:ABC-type Mn2+/Zn2+ transport system ATPase subunit
VGRFSREDATAVDAAIASMQLGAWEHRQVSALSGGQQQRSFLARALAQEAHVFLLDEPFTGLDKPTQDNLRVLLRGLREQGKLIIASHHDLTTGPDIFDRVLFLNGELIAAGPGERSLSRGKHPARLRHARLQRSRTSARALKWTGCSNPSATNSCNAP